MDNSIERQIALKAPIERVWKALTDPREFGAWFGVELEDPFIPGEPCRGHITHKGYEHLVWEVNVISMEQPRYFSFTWHPYAIDPKIDYSTETPTLVEFRLEPFDAGTRLTVTESGFDKVPAHRRDEAMRMNSGGWAQQVKNIKAHVQG